MADLSHPSQDPTPSASTEFAPGDSFDNVRSEELRKDPKYKRYVHAIDKILQSFDAISEWADVIGFLTRLAKTLQAHSTYTIIPRKLLISKRLAQCLNPALPAGVHQKAIEVYGLIFEASGSGQLVEDLPIWSYGLFPFLQNSATNVKPLILALYEKYYLPLGMRLKPSLKGLIVALLPSLEEENNEYFNRVMGILDALSQAVGQGYFFHCVWLSLIAVSHLRLSAVNYLIRRMPKLSSAEDVAVVLGNETSLLARALSVILEDRNLLVQRGALELLVVHFPVQSSVFQEQDFKLVMGAAISVVLRKDMSLNRRLYAWLLESAEAKTLSQDTAKSVNSALRLMFYSASGASATLSKPYKIMISLLDKNEIGPPVLDGIFLDILWSLKGNMMNDSEHKGEISQIATMFLEMVDPFLIWRQLYGIVRTTSLESKQAYEVYLLLDFLLTTFRWNDDESQRVHLPFFLKFLTAHLTGGGDLDKSLSNLAVYIRLCRQVLHLIGEDVLSHSWVLRDFIGASTEDLWQEGAEGRETADVPTLEGPVLRNHTPAAENLSSQIDLFYGSGTISRDPFRSNMLVGKYVLQSALCDLLDFLPRLVSLGLLERTDLATFNNAGDSKLVDTVHQTPEITQLHHLSDAFGEATDMIRRLSTYLDPLDRQSHTRRMSYSVEQSKEDTVITSDAEQLPATNPEWIMALMQSCYMSRNIAIIDSALSCLLGILSSEKYPINTPPRFDRFVYQVVKTLWFFLGSGQVAYHSRTVELLWALSNVSSPYIVETVMCDFLTRGPVNERVEHYERFGVLWRLSEEAAGRSSMNFARPLMLMLDALRSPSPVLRREAETWFRSYVKSYIRILDPLFAILLHQNIRREKSSVQIRGEEQKIFYYTAGFNLGQVDYAYDALLGILRFGDRLFLKSIWITVVKLPDLLEACRWSEDYKIPFQRLTYAELLIIMSLRYIESELQPDFRSESGSLFNESIQARAAEFLDVLVSRSDYMNFALVSVVQHVIIRKLSFCIVATALDLQPRLLHVLHSITALMSMQRTVHEVGGAAMPMKTDVTVSMAADGASAGNRQTGDTASANSEDLPQLGALASSTIFMCTVVDALSARTNRPILQHWMDFILSSLPHMRLSFSGVLLPVVQCLCDQLTEYCDEMAKYVDTIFAHGPESFEQGSPEMDVLVLLYGLEKLFVFCMMDGGTGTSVAKAAHTATGGLRLLTGYVTSVFGSEERGTGEEPVQQRMKEVVLGLLPQAFRILRQLHDIFEINIEAPRKADSRSQISTGTRAASFRSVRERVHYRIKRLLEAVYKVHPTETIETLVEVWLIENEDAINKQKDFNRTAISMMESLSGCTPRQIITIITESLREKSGTNQGPRDRSKRISSKARLTEDFLLCFLENYIKQYADGDVLLNTWSSLSGYVKEISTQAATYKHLLLPILRLLDVYFQKLASSSTFGDKRVQREAEELYQKVCDYCILIAGRAFDHGLWRKSVQSTEYSASHEVPSKDVSMDVPTDLPSQESESPSRRLVRSSDEALAGEVIVHLGLSLIPTLRNFFQDQDRCIPIVTNVVYYIIAPQFRNRQSPCALMDPVMDLVCSMTKWNLIQRTWRREAWDTFTDPKFFEMSLSASRKWRIIIQATLQADKEKVADLIGKISAVPSTSIFISREQETLNRAIALRRLSFAIFCGSVDQYLPHLPSIQEKLVDILKATFAVMHVEAYLCLRVLLCRISASHLANLWPTVVTELIRIFERHMKDEENPKPEDIAVLLSACKFLDLLLVLQIEEFQWHQWIFISETLEVMQDAAHQSLRPVALVDRLSRKWAENHASDPLAQAHTTTPLGLAGGVNSTETPPLTCRRPLITTHAITDKSDLEPFFRSISRYIYDTTYSLAKPDISYIEDEIEKELIYIHTQMQQ